MLIFRRHFFLTLFLLVSSLAAGARPPRSCIAIFNGEQLQQSLDGFSVVPKTKIYKLGSGKFGGGVYRVIPHQENPKIFKEYDSARSAAIDVHRLNILSTLLSKQGDNTLPHFQIVKVLGVDRKRVELSDTRGTDLESVLGDPALASEVKDGLLRKYKACLYDLFQRIQKIHPQAMIVYGSGLIYLNSNTPEDVWSKLYLHQGNIVVTPNEDLVIVDPY